MVVPKDRMQTRGSIGNVSSLQNKNSLKIYCPSSTVSLLGYTDLESTKTKSKKRYKIKSRNQTKKLTPNSILKIRVYPCKELHKIWKQWLAAYRKIYNWTIAYLKKNGIESSYTLQKLAREWERTDWVKELPGHQLQEAVADAVDAYTQALKEGGSAKFKSCRANSQVIKFKVGNYKNGTWYARKTKKLSFASHQEIPLNCEYGTSLVYQKGKWYGCFPQVKDIKESSRQKVIALDPGIRTFLTGYDGETILEVGKKDIGRITRLCSHLDNLMSRLSLSKSKRQRYKQRQAAMRMREKIQNLIKDLHNKVASFLVNNYKVIFLPTFETSSMVVKTQRRLNKKTARNMLTWGHYKFAQHLTQMADRNNCLVVRCNESYSSKTCPECGCIHEKLGGAKVFNCPNCDYKAGRDENGARIMILRALQASAFTVTGVAILLSSFDQL